MVTLIAAWSKDDQEIFRLRDELEATEGPDVTFYDFLGVKANANLEDINKAYKKKSKTMHPDKAKRQFVADKSTGKGKAKGKKSGVHVSKGPSQNEIKAALKAASDRYARLGLVNAILRGPGRDSYDHFLNNGFPKWKGTGYYYARFRPGLGMVLAGLFVFVGGAGHYMTLYMSWKRQQEFMGRYIKFARHAAWGDNLNIPGLDGAGAATPPPAAANDSDADAPQQPLNRRQRRLQEKDARREKPDKKAKGSRAKTSPTATPPMDATGPKKRVVAENGKILVVDAAGNVYLEQKDDEGEVQEFLLDPDEVPPPTIKSTALYRIPVWLYMTTVGRRFLNKEPAADEDADDEDPAEAEADQEIHESAKVAAADDDADDFELLEKVKTSSQNGTGKTARNRRKR
ncbi:MAG: hypothetical protein M1818_002205 [Claussenomyces sp. TS43310]|nr:MAG: hypothetical protein M1818_002205 [Claussenomyces sp. TS43310]